MAGINDGLAAQADEIRRALQEADAPPRMRGIDIIAALEMDPNLTLDDVLGSRPDPQTLAGTGPVQRPRGALLPVPLPDLPSRPANAVEFGEGLQPQSSAERAELRRDARSMAGYLEMAGVAPAHRALVAAREGRPLEAVGNAAVAAMPYRPLAGAAMLGGAYGGALAADTGVLDTTTANAQQRGAATTLPGISPEQQAEYDNASRRLAKGAFGSAAERRQLERSMEGIRAISADFTRAQNASRVNLETASGQRDQEEYRRAVERAEGALRQAQERRIPPFKETNVGRLYEATGGWTPAVVGAGTAGLARTVGRSRPEALVEGTIAGGLTPNAPLVWDLFSQPTQNPERVMYSEYGRDLPPAHPRRQEWIDYANSRPEENPTRRLASQEFYDPLKAAERTGIGALEGLAGGTFGTNLADGARSLAGSIGTGLGKLFGRQPNTPPPSPSPRGRTSAPAPAGTTAPSSATTPASGARETWVSPSGEEKFIDATGRWQNREGFTSPPDPRKWRRISSLQSVHDNIELFGGYPVT